MISDFTRQILFYLFIYLFYTYLILLWASVQQ